MPREEKLQPNKRERLVAAAKTLFYRNGVQHTSIADIAQAAEVPSGNIYYHFRTKDALIEAVIASHAADVHAELARYNAEPEPKARLHAFVGRGLPHRDLLVRFGCPYATLCAELAKLGAPSAASATTLFTLYLEWLERQLRDLAQPNADALALEVLTAVQGAYVVTNAVHQPYPLEQGTARLERWVEAL